MRPIDADKLKDFICSGCMGGDGSTVCRKDCIDMQYIDAMPTIEPEVRRGRWIVHTTWQGMFGLIHSECSECKFDRNGDLSSWKFCPHCGARMDGGSDND